MKSILLTLTAVASLASQAWADGGEWMTDLDAAKEKAKQEKKSLFIDVTGSDWCHWCKVFEKEILSQSEFLDEARKDFVLVKLDFPKEMKQSESLKKQNENFAKKHKIFSFPTVILMTEGGRIFKRAQYQKGGPAPYLAMLKNSLKLKNFR